MSKIGFVGAGNMAAALIKGLIDKNVFNFADIYISDISAERCRTLKNQFGINISVDNIALACQVDILVLSVKPQVMGEVLPQLKAMLKPDALVISIAAGIRIEKIEQFLGKVPVIRVMPNTPALVGCGVSGLFANKAAHHYLEKAKKIFSAVGLAVIVDKEELIDAVTAVSGSGPAYYFLMMEKMIDAAIAVGLDSQIAKQLVLHTAEGAAKLAISSPDSPAELRRKVTSPGGTTQAAIKVFEDNNFDRLISDAVKAAKHRSEDISR